jgi:hypothetical protein
MRRLTRQRRDRGAAALIVCMLFVTGTLFGCAALTVDLGRLSAERRELQNGADAVALAMAADCIKGVSCSSTTSTVLSAAKNLASQNALDTQTAIARASGIGNPICGTFPGLASCAALDANTIYDCPTEPPSLMKYVRVYTRTLLADGTSSDLPFSFGQLFSGRLGQTQQACAQAAALPLGSAKDSFPAVIAECAWDYMTQGGTRYAPEPPYSPAPTTVLGPPAPNIPAVLQPFALKLIGHTNGVGNNDPSRCDRGPAGQFYSGGFGWTDTDDSTHCETTFTFSEGIWNATGSNGASVPAGCKTGGESLLKFVGKTVYVPITTGTSGSSYVISGMAAFYVAGFRAPAALPPNSFDGYTSTFSINAPDVGFWGWFTAPIVPPGDGTSGSTNRGPVSIGMYG